MYQGVADLKVTQLDDETRFFRAPLRETVYTLQLQVTREEFCKSTFYIYDVFEKKTNI